MSRPAALGQAEQILDLLKEQELQDVVATAAPTASAGIEPLKLSPAQQDAEDALPDLEKKARIIEESSLAYAQLQAKPTRTPDDDAQLKIAQRNDSAARKRHSIRSHQ